MVRIRANSGFTLVEVLIASVVFFLVLAAGAWAYSFFSSQITFAAKNINAQTEQLKESILARYILDSVIPYYVKKKGQIDKGVPIFKGGQDGFITISASSLTDPHYPSVIKVQFNKNASAIEVCSMEIVRGIITEIPEFEQVECDNKKTLIGNIADVSFSYFGWDSIDDYFLLRNSKSVVQPKLRWKQQFDASMSEIMPEKIRINVVDQNDNKIALTFLINGRNDSKVFFHRRTAHGN